MIGGHRVGHEEHGHYWEHRRDGGRAEEVLRLTFEEGLEPEEIAKRLSIRCDSVVRILHANGYKERDAYE